MNSNLRYVFDTNTLISHLLLPNSIPAQAVKMGLMEGQLLVSEETMSELATVLSRTKFDPYISRDDRQDFFNCFGRVVEMVHIIKRIKVCKDPKDDKFLDLAINGNAGCIITGDNDLLELHPFQNIRIITPAQFVSLKFESM
jgi:putative PIN family toxin of toxin-antitoxin system